jgi:exopolysaccharide biosynthesis protein
LANGARDVISFGPVLVENGKVVNPFRYVPHDKSQPEDYLTTQAHPRTAIGMIEPNHFIFIVADGRVPESVGMKMDVLAQLFADLGCKTAYNLDGGGSAEMYFNGRVVNNPNAGNGERSTSDILYVKK